MSDPRPVILSYHPREYEFFIPYVVGLCREAARMSGWTNDRWVDFHDKAMAADDDEFLRVVAMSFNVTGKASP